jgi:hypothetical protein
MRLAAKPAGMPLGKLKICHGGAAGMPLGKLKICHGGAAGMPLGVCKARSPAQGIEAETPQPP